MQLEPFTPPKFQSGGNRMLPTELLAPHLRMLRPHARKEKGKGLAPSYRDLGGIVPKLLNLLDVTLSGPRPHIFQPPKTLDSKPTSHQENPQARLPQVHQAKAPVFSYWLGLV